MNPIALLGAAVTLPLIAAGSALADNQDDASTPSPPPVTVMATPPPAPTGVLSTGGSVSSSNPGSGCSQRLEIRNNPPPQSPLNNWYTNGDAGWALGWEQQAWLAPVTTPPIVGCSR